MQVQIEVIKTKDTHIPNAKGGYNILEVTYKNLSSGGKVEGKKLMSFGDYAHVYKAALDWEEDQQVILESQKVAGRDGKEYWTWVNVLGETEVAKATDQKQPGPTPTKQQWVPDEVKQRMIIRQSSLNYAVAFETQNSGTLDNVFQTAEKFFNWVTETPFNDGAKEAIKPIKKAEKVIKVEPEEEVE